MFNRRAVAIAVSLVLAPPVPASAQTNAHAVRQTAPQIAFPGEGATGEPRTVRVGETVLKVPLLWVRAARLEAATSVQGDKGPETIAAGTVLPLHLLSDAAGQPVEAYCTPRRAAERATDKGIGAALFGGGKLWRKMIASATDRQLCLLDADGDARAEASLVIGDGPPQARTPRPIAPAALAVAELAPIGTGDHIALVLDRVSGRGDVLTFRMDVVQGGETRAFDSFSGPWGQSTRHTRVKRAGAATDTVILGTRLTIASADGAAKTALIARQPGPGHFVAVPDALSIVMRGY